ncbi:hypothetical protein BH11PSE10_BH11PSE10_14120 [soil metagenome]
MRAPLTALLFGLVAVAALIVWRGGDERQDAKPAPAASASASAGLPPPLPVPVPASIAPPPVALPTASAALKPALPVKPAVAADRPVRSAFALSSEHQALLEQAVLAAADHDLLEREPRDDVWATGAEQQIRQALARHGRAGDFELLAVECRQTLCAVQAFSYGEVGQREWVKAIDELYLQTLASRFDSVNTAFPNQGRRAAVLTFLHRKAITPP